MPYQKGNVKQPSVRGKREGLMPKIQVNKTNDLVIRMLDFKQPTPISITITDDEVNLIVGNRDIQWDRKTKKVVGSGCYLG
jgi:hypothetical protein